MKTTTHSSIKYLSAIFLLFMVACHRDKPPHLVLNKKALTPVSTFPMVEKVYLYKIIENELIGYIDSNGKVKIAPQFHAAQDFSEGLAAARLDGSYGYIDHTGQYVITPRYDFAQPFNHGLAKVFIDGKPYFIDRQAGIQFQHNFIEIEDFGKHTYARVVTRTKAQGVIYRTGRLIVDTIYEQIYGFEDGVAFICEKDTANSNLYYATRQGLIDTTGKWIVKPGKYQSIGSFIGGYAVVELKGTNLNAENSSEGVIDTKGRYLFTLPYERSELYHDHPVFSEGLAAVELYEGYSRNVRKSDPTIPHYSGIIDTRGQILFCKKEWRDMMPFEFGRSFVRDVDSNWHLIDTKGQLISALVFKDVLPNKNSHGSNEVFSDGIAIVRLHQGWTIIDTLGKVLTTPAKLEFDKARGTKDSYYREGDKIYWIKKDDSTSRAGYYLPSENIHINLMSGYRFMEYLEGGVVRKYAIGNPLITYVDKKGQALWSQRGDAGVVKNLNIDYMNRGYFYASSKSYSDYKGNGGWATSDNKPVLIKGDLNPQSNVLQIIIDEAKEAYWRKQYKGRKIFIVNHSNKDVTFKASDSRLYMTMQAIDKKGIWRDIEYSPQSWCGNSYHTVVLPENSMWEFTSPVYHGGQKTKLRAKLLYLSGSDRQNESILYSNEIDGYINPGQFWNQMEYEAQGIMDPYNN